MALDPNIIMSGQSFDPTKGINAAQNIQHNRAANKLLGMKTQAAQNEAKRNAVVDQLSVKAANGDPNALQQITALDPKRGQAINKLHLQHLHQQIHDEATAAETVKNSANPQQAWNQVRPQLIQKYPHLADHIPDQYDPATVDFLVNNAEKAKTLVAQHIQQQENQAKQHEFGVREGDKAASRQETQRYHNAEIHNDQQRIQLAHQKAQREIAKQNNPEEKLKVASETYHNMFGFQGPGPNDPTFTQWAQGLGLNPPQYKTTKTGGTHVPLVSDVTGNFGQKTQLQQVPGTGGQTKANGVPKQTATSGKYKKGQVVNVKGKRYVITGFKSDGDPLVAPAK